MPTWRWRTLRSRTFSAENSDAVSQARSDPDHDCGTRSADRSSLPSCPAIAGGVLLFGPAIQRSRRRNASGRRGCASERRAARLGRRQRRAGPRYAHSPIPTAPAGGKKTKGPAIARQALEVIGRPCKDRTYDQRIKRLKYRRFLACIGPPFPVDARRCTPSLSRFCHVPGDACRTRPVFVKQQGHQSLFSHGCCTVRMLLVASVSR
jgi:hypothetical protein